VGETLQFTAAAAGAKLVAMPIAPLILTVRTAASASLEMWSIFVSSKAPRFVGT
jgi:hypothetical protein